MYSYDNISRRLNSASTKFAPDVNHLSVWRQHHQELLTLSQLQGDDVTRRPDNVGSCRLKETLRRFDGVTKLERAIVGDY
ncbi:hypothetical protein Tco_0251154 [Tanacetum coccineum]